MTFFGVKYQPIGQLPVETDAERIKKLEAALNRPCVHCCGCDRCCNCGERKKGNPR